MNESLGNGLQSEEPDDQAGKLLSLKRHVHTINTMVNISMYATALSIGITAARFISELILWPVL